MDKMLLDTFQRLNQHDQLDMAMNHGVFLIDYTRYNVVVRLFQIAGYYVEIYSRGDDGEVIMIHAFEDTRYLEPYLEQLELPAALFS